MTTLRNARLDDRIVDVRLEGGRIAAVSQAGSQGNGESIDLEGRWLLPGLWDHHVHLTQHALTLRRVDLAGVASGTSCSAAVTAKQSSSTSTPVG